MTDEQKDRLLALCAEAERLYTEGGLVHLSEATHALIAAVREVCNVVITDDQLVTALYRRAEAAEERARHFARECDKLSGAGTQEAGK